MEYNKQLEEQRLTALKDKFSVKTYAETWKGLRQAVLPIAFLIQIITASLAVGYPAYTIKVITGSWLAGFAVGAILIFAFEYVKRLIVSNISIGYFKALALEKRSRLRLGSVFVLGLVLAFSVLSSSTSTPLLVEEFAPMPAKFSEAAIIAKYDSLNASAAAYWLNVKETAQNKAKEVHKQNNWKGVTVKAARATKLAFESQAAAAVDSLGAAKAVLLAEQKAEIAKAEAKFTADTKQRQGEKNFIGTLLALVTLFLELTFLVCYTWLNYYDYREAVRLDLVKQSKSKVEKQSYPKVPINTQLEELEKQSKVKQVEPHQRPSSGIGFNNEGKVLEEQGKLKILCKTRKGLKAYDSSYLGTLLRDAEKKGQSKAEYWREMKSKLEAHK